MGIVLPALLEERLAADKNLRSAVDGTVADFSAWVNDSKLPFFPDYTDHGAPHLTQVLATAVGLITAEADDRFTCADAAVLVIATLLHDSALHLSELGFSELVKGNSAKWRVSEFDTHSWPELWDEFLFSAKRWDDRRLINVFGALEGGQPRAQVRDPFEHFGNLAEGDRKLIGEFIRAHHTRMAHEFALFGVPGSRVQPIRVDERLGTELTDIAGLIARSHGLPLRRCIDYLGGKYHRREYQGVHAVYLMTLLRVADYIQIQKGRANAIAFRYRHIASPLSQQEWKAHNAILNITQTHDDPESLEIQAKPEDVRTFLRLKEWLAGIQTELDGSWAVLGEVYGSHQELRHLGLILRRVRSNLDDVDAFAKMVKYVPRRIEFDVARAQLLKLLIRPLYGDQPSIGVRELIQNAVDAVRELWFLQKRHPELGGISLVEQQGDVVVWLDDPDETGSAWLTISDRGVGMTEEVVREYFLKAGASFRYTDSWRREFEGRDGTSSSAFKSQVLRSGRFGIGALAAFLLGDEIHVSTRHVSATSGISFATRLDPEPIEIRHDPNLKVGTTVRIRVLPRVQRMLKKENYATKVPGNFDWFCFSKPAVRRVFGKKQTLLDTKYSIGFNGEMPSLWRKLSGVSDYDVYWSYSDAPALNCNGLYVSNSTTIQRFNSIRSEDLYYGIRHPNICVLDPDGNLPLTLQRDAISVRAYPFEPQLLDAIIRDFLAFLLVNTPEQPTLEAWLRMNAYGGIAGKQELRYATRPSLGRLDYGQTMFTPSGLSIFDPSLIKRLAIRTAMHLFSTELCSRGIQQHDCVLLHHDEANPLFVAYLLNGLGDASTGFGSPEALGVRALVRSGMASRMLDADNQEYANSIRLPGALEKWKSFKSKLVVERTDQGWTVLSTQGCPQTLVQFVNLEMKRSPDIALVEVFFSKLVEGKTESGLLGKHWDSIFNQPFIPFDVERRRTELASAYDKLAYYAEFHKAARRVLPA